ncbi:hypothetical protein CR513_46202, partial [Mucuna pruriens]
MRKLYQENTEEIKVISEKIQENAMNNMFAMGNYMIKFNGLNYVDWSKLIQFQLGVMDLDLPLVMDERRPAITETSIDANESLLEAWEQSNRLSLNLEEGRLKKLKDNSIHLMTHDGASTSKGKSSKKDKGKVQLKVNEGGVCKEKKCYFCK